MRIGFFQIYLSENESATLTNMSEEGAKKRHAMENRIYKSIFDMYGRHPTIAIKHVNVMNHKNERIAIFKKPGSQL